MCNCYAARSEEAGPEAKWNDIRGVLIHERCCERAVELASVCHEVCLWAAQKQELSNNGVLSCHKRCRDKIKGAIFQTEGVFCAVTVGCIWEMSNRSVSLWTKRRTFKTTGAQKWLGMCSIATRAGEEHQHWPQEEEWWESEVQKHQHMLGMIIKVMQVQTYRGATDLMVGWVCNDSGNKEANDHCLH